MAVCMDACPVLAAIGSPWQNLAGGRFRARFLLAVPGSAIRCQRVPTRPERVVRPTGFEPVACGSGSRRRSVISAVLIDAYGAAFRRLHSGLHRRFGSAFQGPGRAVSGQARATTGHGGACGRIGRAVAGERAVSARSLLVGPDAATGRATREGGKRTRDRERDGFPLPTHRGGDVLKSIVEAGPMTTAMKKGTRLRTIYRRTDGFCHLCHTKLALKNYARHGARGAWEIEHSRPRASGGTDHGNNLFAACIACNRSKGKGSTRSARRKHGHTRAPYGRVKKARVRSKSAICGGALGAVGGSLLSPAAVIIGAIFGALAGHEKKVR